MMGVNGGVCRLAECEICRRVIAYAVGVPQRVVGDEHVVLMRNSLNLGGIQHCRPKIMFRERRKFARNGGDDDRT